MSNWKITGPPRFFEHVGMVYPVTKGGSRFNASEQDELEALLAGWQPIDTAPKDGSRILLGRNFGETSVVIEGWWQNEEDDGPDYMGADGGFVDHEFNRFMPGRSFGNPAYRQSGCQPTHWQPLPSPPTN